MLLNVRSKGKKGETIAGRAANSCPENSNLDFSKKTIISY
jgi:hypothetical protein